jgi:hypothetical protein
VDIAALETRAIHLLEIVGAQIIVRLVVTHQMGENHQDTVRYRQDGFLFAPSAREAVKLGRQLGA